jgi:DNA-binding response OmpR family regulator
MDNNEKRKILITEDESAMRNALSDKFVKEGFEVISAQDGEEGLRMAIENKPDLIMLDIIMPKMDGISVMKNIREKGSWGEEVPILMLTNLSDPESVSEAAKYKVYDFLVKTDWRLEDIVKLVREKLAMEI